MADGTTKTLAAAADFGIEGNATSTANANSETPAEITGPNRKNIALFDLTLWMFKKAKRKTEKFIEQATECLPDAYKRLEIAQRVLPSNHPQREPHIICITNLENTLKCGRKLLTSTATRRQAYIDNMPEYTTGEFGAYNRNAVLRLLDFVNAAFETMRMAGAGLKSDAQFKNLKRLQAMYEHMNEEELEPRTICE
jgi:hypothetical protein